MKYDELLKILRECNDCICEEHCPYHEDRNNPVKCMTKIVGDAADAIEELQNRLEQALFMPLPKWIPVSERLPEVGQRVLFSYRSYIKKRPRTFIGWYNGKQWDSLVATEYDVTHWMPLPEPPKEET